MRRASLNRHWRLPGRLNRATNVGSFSCAAELLSRMERRLLQTQSPLRCGGRIPLGRYSPKESLSSSSGIPRLEGGRISGTGPFSVSQWNPGKKLALMARDEYWGGRPFLDAIEIELGKSLGEQMISLDLGKTQLIEVAPEQAHRAIAEGRHIESSASMELIALAFRRDPQSPEDARQRQALALSIDRDLLSTVVLQGGGEPAGGLLPNWMTGYAFLFPASIDLAAARQLRSEIPHTTSWTLGYDPADPTARVIAERIVLNARDAGMGMQITTASSADLRIVRLPLVSIDAQIALSELAAGLGLSPPKFTSSSVDDLYNAENKLLQSQRVIPLLHLRTAYGVSNDVKNWRTARDGSWRLADVWLDAAKP